MPPARFHLRTYRFTFSLDVRNLFALRDHTLAQFYTCSPSLSAVPTFLCNPALPLRQFSIRFLFFIWNWIQPCADKRTMLCPEDIGVYCAPKIYDIFPIQILWATVETLHRMPPAFQPNASDGTDPRHGPATSFASLGINGTGLCYTFWFNQQP